MLLIDLEGEAFLSGDAIRRMSASVVWVILDRPIKLQTYREYKAGDALNEI